MKQFNIKTLFTALVATVLFVSSCQKDNGTDNQTGGKAAIAVNMNGIGLEDGAKLLARAAGVSATSTAAVQQVTVPFGEDLVVRATLTEVKSSTTSALRASASKAATTSTGTGAIKPFNGNFTIRVYKQGSTSLETTINCIGGTNNNFELEPGAYRFVVTAYGNEAATGADKDPLWQEINQTVTAGTNALDILLKHKLTEVTVKFDAGSGRTISAIGGATITPNFNYAFDELTGLVSYSGTGAVKNFSFPAQTAGQIWTSNAVMIAVENTNVGQVKLDPVTINGVVGNVELKGLSLRQGVQYTLDLKLGSKIGIDVGEETWSSGNLEYNPNTGEYGFGGINTIGDYWFANYIKPKKNTGNVNDNQQANSTDNGPLGDQGGDPCALVAPKGTWRLPTRAEVQALIDAAPQTKFKDYYNPLVKTAETFGLFLGANAGDTKQNLTAAQRNTLLFMPLAGYHSNDLSFKDRVGREFSYIVRTETGDFLEWFYSTQQQTDFAAQYYVGGLQSFSAGRASQIRCLKK
ncbi:fimbrillin family protein [Sphingobacterium sp.]|uniref:fimbrillin family protein n=1 Tax=Sphingobacterium sp. TaxID=341027 RepID=UPI0031DDFA8F